MVNTKVGTRKLYDRCTNHFAFKIQGNNFKAITYVIFHTVVES